MYFASIIYFIRFWQNGAVYRGYWDRGDKHGHGEFSEENEKREGIFK